LKAGDDYKGETDNGDDGERPKEDSLPEPTAFQREIYNDDATLEAIGVVLTSEDDKEAIKSLDRLNETIKEANRKASKNEDDGIIKYQQYITHRRLMPPAEILYRNTDDLPDHDPQRKEAKNAAAKAWDIMRILDLFNQQHHYPRTWNFDDLSNAPKDLPEAPKTLGSLNPTDPPKYKTEKGLPVHGIRNASGNGGGKNGQPGGRSYQFVVENGKPWATDNCLDLKSSGDLGYGWADRLVKILVADGKWDELNIANSKKKVSRQDAEFFTRIKGIASNPIRTKKIGSEPRYPQSYSYTEFANGERVWHHILDRSALVTLLGKGAADDKIAEFYTTRKLTPPWEVGPLNWTTGKPRAIDSVPHLAAANHTRAAPATAAPVIAAQVAPGAPAPGVSSQPTPATAAPQPPASEQLLLTNRVEGLAEQMAEMMRLMAQLLPRVPQPQPQPTGDVVMA
jgi:hypothetical protein